MTPQPWFDAGRVSAHVAAGILLLALRAAALALFVVMSLAEPFHAVALGGLSLACFFVAVFFGFILQAPFHHRWFVLGASVALLVLYLLYRCVMLGVQKLLYET
ncbi:MAG TPA: hypothetical protein VGD63_01255 [Steroidobacteraceae bacterium]